MSDSYQAVYDAVRSRIGNVDIASAVSEAIRLTCDASYIIPGIAQDISIAVERVREASMRPSVLYRPRIFVDGNQWCALYGDNLQDGVAGFGSFPEEAMLDFDTQWKVRHAVFAKDPTDAR